MTGFSGTTYVLLPLKTNELESGDVHEGGACGSLDPGRGNSELRTLMNERAFVAVKLKYLRVHFGSASEEVKIFLRRDEASAPYLAADSAGLDSFPSLF